MKNGLRIALFLAIGVLYVLSIPWYRADDQPLRMVFGLPDWVAVAVGCYCAVAVLNSVAWLLTDVDDDAEVEVGGSSIPTGEKRR